MCGFTGEFTPDLSESELFLDNLNKSIHRGPDQQNSWTDHKHCQLGFNRLAILDLSERALQPIISPTGRFAFVFNGEIYNWKKLREKYKIPAHLLRSTADSEIIAHLLDLLPIPEVVKELNGMFAIAIYHIQEKKLTLTRDFAGIKPLFFGTFSKGIIFASQFDQVFNHPKIKKKLEIDPGGLYDYAATGYMPAPRTVFKNIFQCEPGEIIQIDLEGNITKQKLVHWDQDALRDVEESEESTYLEFDKILNNVVSDQLVADVPVGLFLSGGIDSPLIAAYARNNKSDISAYTIGIEGNDAMDESKQAELYAKHLKLPHKIIHFDEQELLRLNDCHFNKLSEPFGDYSSLPTFLLTMIARRECKVMLSGDGGDELFFGYPRFLNTVNNFNWFNYPMSIRRIGSGIFRRAGRRVSYAVSQWKNIPDWVLEQQSHNSRFSLTKLLPGLSYSHELSKLYDNSYSFESKSELLHWLRWNEFYGHLQRVLAKVDRTSMGNSLEVRVPFLDKRVIDFAWRMNSGLGIRHQTPKYLLKYGLRQKMGNTFIDNNKRGFTVPVRKWLRKELRKDFESHLLDMPLFGEAYWNRTELEKNIKAFMLDNDGNEWGLWILYAMQKWANQHKLN